MSAPPSTQSRRAALKGLAAILALQQAPALHAQQRLLVGQSAPLSGPNADFGRAIVAGARAAILRHNARGTGFNVDLMAIDDANDAARSAANSEALIGQGASALFGYASATLSLPALPVVRRTGVPLFAPFTGAATIHNLQDPLVFTARASYAQEAEKFMEALDVFGVKTVAVVHFADRIGQENRDVVVEAIKRSGRHAGPFVAIERNQPVPPDAAAALAQAKPDGVLFTVLAAPTAQLVRQARASGLKPLTFLMALSFVGPSQLVGLLGDEARGIAVSHVVPRPWESLEVAQEHALALRALPTPEAPSFASLESYIAAKALTTVLERTRSARPEALVAGLEQLSANFGGYRLRYGKGQRNGSSFVAYTILGKEAVRS
jgi:branched-chain amino acid transport system substrate-binding protein